MNKKSFLTAFVLFFASLILMPIKVSAIAILTYRAACDVYLKDGTQIRDAEFTIPKNSTFKKFTIKVEGKKRIIKSDEVDYLVVYHRKQDAQHGFVLKYITWKKGGRRCWIPGYQARYHSRKLSTFFRNPSMERGRKHTHVGSDNLFRQFEKRVFARLFFRQPEGARLH